MPVSQSVSRDNRVVFSQGDRSFTVKDVIDWAFVHGEVDLLWKDFLRVVDADRRASEQGLETDESALDEASIAFRYEHDLITAEETERWLEDRGLTLAEFSEYFGRRYWEQTDPEDVKPDESRRYESASAEEKDLFVVDLTLSGELDRMADRLSWRVAAQAEGAIGDTGAVAAERERLLTRAKIDPDRLGNWLGQLHRDKEWLDELLVREVAYGGQTVSLITEKDLRHELVSLRLMLTRFEIEMIEVDSRDAAAEIVACVRSDGMEMAEVAEESRYPFHRSEVLLEDIAVDQQQQFLSVKAGALLEPIPREDSFEVCRVKSRIEPTLEDPAIRQRLKDRILERHFSELVSKHINWRILQPLAE